MKTGNSVRSKKYPFFPLVPYQLPGNCCPPFLLPLWHFKRIFVAFCYFLGRCLESSARTDRSQSPTCPPHSSSASEASLYPVDTTGTGNVPSSILLNTVVTVPVPVDTKVVIQSSYLVDVRCTVPLVPVPKGYKTYRIVLVPCGYKSYFTVPLLSGCKRYHTWTIYSTTCVT